ncbi:MAG: DNA polymerase Y family protein [Hyphomicrobiaceae bacterium]
MSRIVSVWLPRWPIQRFLKAQAHQSSRSGQVDPDRPFVFAVDASGGPRIAALNAAAETFLLRAGDPISDARAKIGEDLQVRPAAPDADSHALRRLALWATRYTPTISVWGEESGADGFYLEITGAAHLAGGEDALLADLYARLKTFDLRARLAIADTAGMAWALSHCHRSATVALPSGQEAEAFAGFPIEALRLTPDTRTTLRRLGFKRVGALLDKERAPFAARFPAELLQRLDQALGRIPEPLPLITPAPVYHVMRQLLEPIATQEAIVAAARQLMEDLVPALVGGGVGARALQLALYRVDGVVATIDIGLTAPTRHPEHVARFISLKLDRIVEEVDAGFGFEALGLAVQIAERMEPKQAQLAATARGADSAERCATLVDGLRQRLGVRSVRRLVPVESHLPERSEAPRTPVQKAPAWPAADEERPRPLLLLPRPEEIEVTALVPEGPPRRFRWRGVMHGVARAQGPERIADEWWRSKAATRDYYLVEDSASRHFWIYRAGLYGRETPSPRWFMHGLFA